jgi:predicted dehydrogenase
MTAVLRIGIVGAGDNTQKRHIPGLRAIRGVEVAGVVNRTLESTQRAAASLGIPKTYPDWHALIQDDDLDAVVIGTWPDLHCEVACAALAAGKHVLTEARMARNLTEARQMLDAGNMHPGLTAMIVPSPCGLVCEDYIRHLIAERFLGELREFVILGGTSQFADYSQPIHWRQDATISGVNTLALGILHETWLRWFPQPTRVVAQSHLFEPVRPAASGPGNVAVTVPDSVQVLAQLSSGACGVYHLSGIQRFGPGLQMHFYGRSGTIKIIFGDDDEQVFVGRSGDPHLRDVPIPAERRGCWRVEEEFIAAIRGEAPVRRTDFATGVRYMAFTEAVLTSARTGAAVTLPAE